MIKQLATILLLVISISTVFGQIEKELPAKPSPPRLVVDYTNTLAADQQEALERKLVTFDDSSSSQIAVVIIETTGDRDISDYAVALGRAWGIGNKEFNNGVLLLVAKSDRKIWIATGYGLEGALPDAIAKSIIDNDITPNFRENDFYRGLDEGTNAIISAIAGEYTAPADYHKRKKKDTPPIVIIIIIIFLILGFIRRGGGGGHYHRRGYNSSGGPGGIWFFPSGGGSSFGGGSSGGGFGGFGGGSFGGGGAGGSW
ncbi:MAG: TPM domain-containing protein [bacterium]